MYAADKPKNCKYCYFWKRNKKCCSRGEENCYYLITTSQEIKEESECDGCPYGRDQPCIGWCTKQVIQEVLQK